jgi:hypothetical protein
LCAAIHRILAGALRRRLRRLAREKGMLDVETGSVTFVQRYGGGHHGVAGHQRGNGGTEDLNLNPHYHLFGVDGWFVHNKEGALNFQEAPAPLARAIVP